MNWLNSKIVDKNFLLPVQLFYPIPDDRTGKRSRNSTSFAFALPLHHD